MQNAQNISWLAVLAPSLITGLFVVIVQILSAYWFSKKTEGYKKDLSKEIEDYKKGISKELESHKTQLQSDFQTTFYQFQTRYSLLHQKRAEAIEKLFGLLAKVQNDLQIWANWEARSHKETKEEFYSKTREHFQHFIEFHDEKRIYFDQEIQDGVSKIVKTTNLLLSGHDSIEFLSNSLPELASEMKDSARNIFDLAIHPVMEQLENKFKRLLAAELPNYQLERKQ
jgi:hypothetical protein